MSKNKIELEIGPRLAKTIRFVEKKKVELTSSFFREYREFLSLFVRAANPSAAETEPEHDPMIELAEDKGAKGCITERAWGRCGKPLAPGASHYCVDCLMSPTKTEIEMIEQKESEST